MQNEILENTIAQLHLVADNGGLVSLTANEAQAILEELRYGHGYERAYRAAEREYDELASETDIGLGEQLDLIGELHQAGRVMAEYIALIWKDAPHGEPAFMLNARAKVAKAGKYLRRYRWDEGEIQPPADPPWHGPQERLPCANDLDRGLEQLRLCAEGHRPSLLPREARALLQSYEALEEAVKAIAREGDPYTATQDWPSPEGFAEWATEQACAAVEENVRT